MRSCIFLLLVPLTFIPAYADDGSEDSITALGWVAIGAGVIGTIPFVVLNKIRRYAVNAGGTTVQIAKQISQSYKPVLNFHIMLNSIGYFAGMSHGLLLSRHLDYISLSLAIVMTVIMASGLLLKYTSSRNSKIFNRLLHGQFGLVFLLGVLVILHVITADD